MRTAFNLLVVILVTAGLGWYFYISGHRVWTAYWLLQDGREGTAVITQEVVAKEQGLRYGYTVNGHNFDGGPFGSPNDERERQILDARRTQRLPVYYSESHPWLSNLYRPTQKGLNVALFYVALPLVVFPVGIGIAIWNRPRWRARRMAGRAAWATSGHARPTHTITSSWEVCLDAVEPAGDITPGPGDTETVSVDEVTLYQVMGADGRERTYHSLDEMPPKLRAQVEKAFAHKGQAQAGGHRHDSQSPPHKDAAALADAIDRASLAALDEIPPETRHQFEEFAAPPKPGQKFTFKFRGPDGQEHTYHSLDELPPDVRAIYDRLVHRGSGPQD